MLVACPDAEPRARSALAMSCSTSRAMSVATRSAWRYSISALKPSVRVSVRTPFDVTTCCAHTGALKTRASARASRVEGILGIVYSLGGPDRSTEADGSAPGDGVQRQARRNILAP